MLETERLRSIFEDYPYIAAAYLFGSHVTGKKSQMSDVDIAVLLKEPYPEGRELMHAMDYMAYRIERVLDSGEVDLVVLNEQRLIFQHNVLRKGKSIYEANPSFRIEFTVKIISNFCDFEPTLRFMNNYYFEGSSKSREIPEVRVPKIP